MLLMFFSQLFSSEYVDTHKIVSWPGIVKGKNTCISWDDGAGDEAEQVRREAEKYMLMYRKVKAHSSI